MPVCSHNVLNVALLPLFPPSHAGSESDTWEPLLTDLTCQATPRCARVYFNIVQKDCGFSFERQAAQ